MAQCKACSRNNEYVGKLLDGGEFELDIEFVGGVVIGAVVASKADLLLDKVEMLKENKMYKSGIKIALGVLLTQTNTKVIEGAGNGMIAVGASEILGGVIDGFLEPKDPAVKGPYKEQPGTGLTYINGIAYLNGVPVGNGEGTNLEKIANANSYANNGGAFIEVY